MKDSSPTQNNSKELRRYPCLKEMKDRGPLLKFGLPIRTCASRIQQRKVENNFIY